MKCCDLNAGKLRHNIVIERATSIADGAGGTKLTWATVATLKAFVKPVSGGERFASQRLEATVTHRVFIRYRTGLMESDRINFGGRLMQVRALINLEERNRWIEIYAEEGVVT